MWLRAGPGTGKTRLLGELIKDPSAESGAVLMDAPTPDELQAALWARRGAALPATPRLIVASRVGDPIAGVLIAERMYGTVDIIDDAEMFVTTDDLNGEPGQLYDLTAGWPVLLDACVLGRIEEVGRILPAYLQREVLPDLPHATVTALFAALPAPLSPAAVTHLFGVVMALHPLLKRRSDGVIVASSIVREALVGVRARAHALAPAVRADLVYLYTALADPARSIASLLALGQVEQAVEVFERAGGVYFGYRHGYHALQAVLDDFGPELERRTESLALARLWLLIKSGRPHEVLLRLESQFPGLPVDLRDQRLPRSPYALLLRIELSLDEGERLSPETVTGWGRLESLFPPSDALARGLLYNTMAIGFLQADALTEARQLALEALSVYDREQSPYLVHYMQLHLCDIALRESRPRDAADWLARAEAALDASQQAFNSEHAIVECFRSRIAYEEGRFEMGPMDIELILGALLRGDSWPDLITTLSSHLVYTAYWQHGMRAALDTLDQCALTLSRRHGPLHRDALVRLRIRLHQMARRPAEAAALLEEYDLESPAGRFGGTAIEVGLIRLRQQILQQRPPEESLALARSLAGAPGLRVRHQISLGIIQAGLHLLAGGATQARDHLGSALRRAEAQSLLGVLVEEGPLLERLLPWFVAEAGPGRAHQVAFAERVLRLLRSLPAAPSHSKALAGVSRQEHRVLAYVIDGYTNKQIGRALLLSESGVKFHLRNLFRKLEVRSRRALRDAARNRGLVT